MGRRPAATATAPADATQEGEARTLVERFRLRGRVPPGSVSAFRSFETVEAGSCWDAAMIAAARSRLHRTVLRLTKAGYLEFVTRSRCSSVLLGYASEPSAESGPQCHTCPESSQRDWSY